MIVAGTYPPISIDLGKNEPGVILQREVKRDQWNDYLANRNRGENVTLSEHPQARLAGLWVSSFN